MSALDAEISALFSKLDNNSDKIISEQEWQQAFEAADTQKTDALSRKAWQVAFGGSELYGVIQKASIAQMKKSEWMAFYHTCKPVKGGVSLELLSLQFSGHGQRMNIEKKAWDGDGVPLEESNVSGIGSDEDKELRKKAAGTEPAWEGIGLEPGLWIFRIESFKVVPWPKEKYGQFHTGDSYIVLKTEFGVEEETGEPSEKLEYDIHFWLGKETSTDEKGTAAYKTVELDDFFDGDAVQHREVEKNESPEFMELFPNGVQYLEGGVESGFKVTQIDMFTKKLYQVRRTQEKSIVFEEEEVALKTLNHRDCFILDAGRKIYTWFGDDASPFVKNACNMKAEKWENERNGESKVITEVDDEFWEALGGKGEITAADKVGAEVEADFGEGVLYSIQIGDDRKLNVTEKGRGQLERSMLDPTGVMMVDTRKEIFLWLGKDASELEKRSAWTTATNFLKMNNRNPDKTAITILKQGKGRNNKAWKAMFPV